MANIVVGVLNHSRCRTICDRTAGLTNNCSAVRSATRAGGVQVGSRLMHTDLGKTAQPSHVVESARHVVAP